MFTARSEGGRDGRRDLIDAPLSALCKHPVLNQALQLVVWTARVSGCDSAERTEVPSVTQCRCLPCCQNLHALFRPRLPLVVPGRGSLHSVSGSHPSESPHAWDWVSPSMERSTETERSPNNNTLDVDRKITNRQAYWCSHGYWRLQTNHHKWDAEFPYRDLSSY